MAPRDIAADGGEADASGPRFSVAKERLPELLKAMPKVRQKCIMCSCCWRCHQLLSQLNILASAYIS